MRRLCYAIDLKADPVLIKAYEDHHGAVWPTILARLRDDGVLDMEIHRVDDRLLMIMEVDETFDPAARAKRDASDPEVLAWERLMDEFQQRLPNSPTGEKWRSMSRIFSLKEALASQNPALNA